MVSYLPMTAERLSSIRSATSEDIKLQRVREMILAGWPQNKTDIQTDIQHYHSFQDELSFQDGIVFRGERAVISHTLRADIIQRVHSSHLGVEGCLRWARECVYWQGMSEQIKTFISKCDIYRAVDPKNKERHYTHMIWHTDPGPRWEQICFPSGTRLFDNSGLLLQLLGG